MLNDGRTREKLEQEADRQMAIANRGERKIGTLSRDLALLIKEVGDALRAARKARRAYCKLAGIPPDWEKYRDAHFEGCRATACRYAQIAEPANWAKIAPRLTEGRKFTINDLLAIIHSGDPKAEKPSGGTTAARLLAALQAVSPGLAPREIVEQSAHFILRRGRVWTYNDEVLCSHPLPDFAEHVEGAVPAEQLLAYLAKIAGADIEMTIRPGVLKISGPRGYAKLRLKGPADIIVAAIDQVERPGTWAKLPEAFCEAVAAVAACASKNHKDEFKRTVVHLHPEWVEACDNYRMCRRDLETGVGEGALVRATSLEPIAARGVTELSETANWLHFRSPSGAVLSCRRFAGPYDDLGKFLDAKGEPFTFPDGLRERVQITNIFAKDNPEEIRRLTISLGPAKLEVEGRGASGRAVEWLAPVDYQGPPLKFTIEPKVLLDLLKRNPTCEVTAEQLVMRGEQFAYVASLGRPDEGEEPSPEQPAKGKKRQRAVASA
jgi:hypothetical protein